MSCLLENRILEVYAWGNDEFGQLGHGGSGDENLTGSVDDDGCRDRTGVFGLLEEEAVLLKHTRRAKRATSYKLHPHPISWNKKEQGALEHIFTSANCNEDL